MGARSKLWGALACATSIALSGAGGVGGGVARGWTARSDGSAVPVQDAVSGHRWEWCEPSDVACATFWGCRVGRTEDR